MKSLLLCLLISCISCGSTVHHATMPFDWIIGKWRMVAGNDIAEEEWKRKDSTYIGFSSMGKLGESLMPFEDVVLKKEANVFVYTVTGITDKKVVPFTCTKYSRTGFVVENSAHDYPKRISYELIGTDSIVAFIDNGKEINNDRIYFNYKRIKQ